MLAFPCNQFGNQEPGTNEQVLEFAQKKYGVTYRMHAKIDVNGSNAHPLFEYIKKEARGILGTAAIKWNFTKFVVDREGKVVDRYGTKTSPASLVDQLETLLG